MTRFLVLGAALVVAVPGHATGLPPADERALNQLASRMDEAWTIASAEANADLFTVSATARFGSEPLGEGREAIREQFRTFFKDRPAGLRHVTKIERVEQVGAGLAMWDAEVLVERQQGNGDWKTLTRIRNVTLAVRQTDGWRVHAVRAFPIP